MKPGWSVDQAGGVEGSVSVWGQRGAAGFLSSTLQPLAPPSPGTCCAEGLHAKSTQD